MLKFIYFTKLVYIIDTVSQILKSGMSLNVFKKIESPKNLFDIFFYLDRFEGFWRCEEGYNTTERTRKKMVRSFLSGQLQYYAVNLDNAQWKSGKSSCCCWNKKFKVGGKRIFNVYVCKKYIKNKIFLAPRILDRV